MLLHLPGVFSDDMVLQRDYRLPVWGWAAPGAEVVVALADQEALASADGDGCWRVTLAPLPAGGPLMTGSADDYLTEKILRPEPLGLPMATGAITVDGDLAEWAEIPAMPLPYEDGRTGSVRLCWVPDGLYGAVESIGGAPVLNRDMPYQADALELFVDKSLSRGVERDEHASQYIFAPDPEGGPGAGLKRIGYGSDIYRTSDMQCAWQPTDAGYNLEFHIPSALLVPASMEVGTEIGLNFAVTSPGGVVEQFYSSKALYAGWQRSITWGIVELK